MSAEGTFSGGIDLKIDLQARGVRIPDGLRSRAGGAGPADGITIFLDGVPASVPSGAWYARRSPYEIRHSGESWELLLDGVGVCGLDVAGEPEYYREATPDSIPYYKVALRHGRDGIGSTVVQGCAHGDDSCRFCAIAVSAGSGETVPRKSPEDLARVAAAARLEGYSHLVLTTGTTPGEDRGIEPLLRCAAAVKGAADMKMHVQFEPPGDLEYIDRVAEVADSVAINIESFDREVLTVMAPGKAATGLSRYRQAWERSVEALGEGHVTSFIIIGLGESEESVLEGCRLLTSMGVYPFLLPLRPLAGTPLEAWSPPGAEEMKGMYEKAAAIVAGSGLHASTCDSGCVYCGACTAFTDITG
ncbi:MAG: MSMEG_0568 family radical SAM protein [Actinobacteria bacterium]|nr:MSMEG_0568 family radical SAM protein [Actinomycetota bacterium]